MSTCLSCSAPVLETSRFCPSCGARLDASSAIPTGTAPQGGSGLDWPHRDREGAAIQDLTPSGRAAGLSSTASAAGRFAPGRLLLDRYRIVGLLGKGGMGEVYRADDLRLGMPVALKFLPEKLAGNPDRLGRFHNEVRVAREISHPAVCRVHDIGDVEGQPFLSMEYVDGENLSSLLRRIGRLPSDKALDIVRQVCAGLAAAHDKGVLHRDLKPENIMLDGRGRARITDFGLAGLAEDITGAEVRSGTPAYMAPEQLAGREVTSRSDVYALGLVLYELFTGRRAFEARSLAEITRKHAEETPSRPSSIVPDLDPAVESVILRCLEKDPRRRPASALSVAAALPGGDPLAAALAAGETPSPEMVAAAGEEGGLRTAHAWAAFVALLLGMVLAVALKQGTRVSHLVPFDKSPPALEDRALEILEELGSAGPVADRASGLLTDRDYLRHVATTDDSRDRWESLRSGRPAVSTFWLRQSPRPLIPSFWSGRVSWNDPPVRISGMTGVQLDMQGRLVWLYELPPQVEEARQTFPRPDWSGLFERAGLDIGSFETTEPRWTPPFYCEERVAWEGAFPETPDTPIRVEAAAYRGRPVFFRIVGEWTRPERMQSVQRTAQERVANGLGAGLLLSTMIAAAYLARRNLRLGRGDAKGAFRLAGYTFAASMLAWALQAHHVAAIGGELFILILGLGIAFVASACMWLLYVALEPFVRRRWPDALISWSRLLGGRLRDPLVGRHVLLGGVAGALCAAALLLIDRIPQWLDLPPSTPGAFGQEVLLGPRHVAAALIDQQVEAVAMALGLLLLLVLLRGLLRSERLAALVLVLVLAMLSALQSDVAFGLSLALSVLTWTIPAIVVLRLGLLALCSTIFFLALLVNFPLAADPSHWTGSASLLILAIGAGVAAYGFHTSLAGRPLFREELLHE